MLDTEWSTGNIFQKARSKSQSYTTNVLYESYYNIFDQLLQQAIPDICFVHKNVNNSFFNFDFTSNNSIFISPSEINNIYNTYTDLVIFNHEDVSNMKKEDKAILNHNVKNVKVINFNSKSNSIFANALNIEYPFPNLSCNVDRIKDLLIIDTKQHPFSQSVLEYAKLQGISADLIKKVDANISELYTQFSQYKIILDTSQRINHILALLAGCHVITQSNIDGYFESKYTFKFNDHNEILTIIKKCLSKETKYHTEIADRYSSKDFSKKFKEYIYGNN
tara:strand:- start:419 stop:1252 length:834 start_codon:yes stop_codon:yes gene_type:complete